MPDINFFKKISIYILPLIFVIGAVLVHFSYGDFFMNTVDPEYFHLFNGLNLAIFNLAVDYIAHPGTTLQMLYAISSHIGNLYFPGSNLITTALNYPEQFIHGASILLILLIGMALYYLGFKTQKVSGDTFLALLIQLMPFSNHKLINIFGRILPETALMGTILLLAAITIVFLYDKNRDQRMRRYLLGFAIIGGIGAASKLNYFPFLIVPFFLLPDLKARFRYFIYTIISIVAFAFPLFVNIKKSVTWFGNMFLHSGQWGSGNSNIIDLETFPKRISQIYQMDQTLFFLLGVAILMIIVFVSIPKLRKINGDLLFIKALISYTSVVLLFTLLVAKHFSAHYFYPVLQIKVILLFLMVVTIQNVLATTIRIKRFIPAIFFVGTIFFVILPEFSQARFFIDRNLKVRYNYEDRVRMLKQYDTRNNTCIISSHYSGSPFIESAMVDAFLLSGSLKSTFKQHLITKFPNTYFYFNWSDKFYFWDIFMNPKDFMLAHDTTYIFIGKGKEENLNKIIESIRNDFPEYQINAELLYHFKAPEEYFYQVLFERNTTVENDTTTPDN